MSNTGFLDVDTAPAGAGSLSVPDLGTFAPLAGPTVGPDGTVFLATLEGKVIALHADGSAYWNRELPGARITSAPVVGSDGSVYVVGDYGIVRDHRHGETMPLAQTKLYRFTPGGGASPGAIADFPPQDSAPVAIGAPNDWRFGNDEAIFVTALYPTLIGPDLHLLAFSTNGGVMADWGLHLGGGEITASSGWDGFTHGVPGMYPPFPGVAIAASPQGGTPAVMLVDRHFGRTIGFMFCVGASCSPAPGFTELFRTDHQPRALQTAPVIMPDMHTIVGTDDGVVFSGPNMIELPPVTGLGDIPAPPTIAANARVLLVNGAGDVLGLQDGAVVSRTSLGGRTIARAVASHSHVFVSYIEALYTLDAEATASVSRFSWFGGGFWPPAIGPEGHVYAMASNVLFVFPPPRKRPQGPQDVVRGALDLPVG
jgi:hypothetical protein